MIIGHAWEPPRIAVTSGGTTYFYPSDNTNSDDKKLYIPFLPHVSNSSGSRSLKSFFINEDLRQEYQKRVAETVAVLDQNGMKTIVYTG